MEARYSLWVDAHRRPACNIACSSCQPSVDRRCARPFADVGTGVQFSVESLSSAVWTMP